MEARDPPEELQPQRAEERGGEGLEAWRVADLVHVAHLRHDEGEAEEELPLDEEGDGVGGGAEGDDARVASQFHKRGGDCALPSGVNSLDAIAKGGAGSCMKPARRRHATATPITLLTTAPKKEKDCKQVRQVRELASR